MSHGYGQHADSEWRVENCILYSSYLIGENRDLPDTVDFAYEDSIALKSRIGGTLFERALYH